MATNITASGNCIQIAASGGITRVLPAAGAMYWFNDAGTILYVKSKIDAAGYNEVVDISFTDLTINSTAPATVSQAEDLLRPLFSYSGGATEATAIEINNNQTNGDQTTQITGSKLATYSANVTDLVVDVTGATDIVTIAGNSTKVIKVLSIYVDGNSDEERNLNISIIKRSTANTSGTSTALIKVPHDSSLSASAATVLAYTASPTLGTAIGVVHSERILLPKFDTLKSGQKLSLKYESVTSMPIVLKSSSELLCVSLNGAVLTTPAINVTIKWTEEDIAL